MDSYLQKTEAAAERAADFQRNRDRSTALEANQIGDAVANRDTSNKIRLMREESLLKNNNGSLSNYSSASDEAARSKSNLDYLRSVGKNDIDRKFAQDEADKTRYQQITQQNLDRQQQKELASMSQANARSLANIAQQTQLADQNSRFQQAALAAKAQVSSAILGNRQSYGSYW